MTHDDLKQPRPASQRAAFDDLYAAHFDSIYRLVRGFVRDPERAEDLTQEVFVQAHLAWDQFRGESDVRTWLHRIAVNHCLTAQRADRAQAQREQALPPWLPEPDLDPLESLLVAERRAYLRQLLAMLPEEQYVVLILRYYAGLPLKEIAQVVGCAEGTVASRLHYGIAALKGKYGQGFRPEAAAPTRAAEARFYARLGRVYFEQADNAAGEEAYLRALGQDPENVAIRCELGWAYRHMGRFAEALEQAERAVAAAPGRAEAHHLRGCALCGLRRFDEAAAALQTALSLGNDGPAEVHKDLGNVYLSTDRTAEALAEYDRALALDPQHVKARVNRANVRLEAGRWEEAVVDYRVALEQQPDFANGHYNLAVACEQLGRVEEAIRHYARATELLPHWPEPHGYLGLLLLAQGRADEAQPHLATALNLPAVEANSFVCRGRIYQAQGQLDRALREFEEALRRRPDHREAREALGELRDRL